MQYHIYLYKQKESCKDSGYISIEECTNQSKLSNKSQLNYICNKIYFKINNEEFMYIKLCFIK